MSAIFQTDERKREGHLQQLQHKCPELEITSFTPVNAGENNDVYIVNDEWVFRFPKYAAGIAQLERESALLRFLKGKVSVPIPYPLYQHVESRVVGEVFAGYPLLAGEPTRPEMYEGMQAQGSERRFAEQLAGLLKELHSTSTVKLQKPPVNLPPFSTGAWRDYWVDMYRRMEGKLFPHMRPDARIWTTQHFAMFLDDPRNFVFEPVLLHGDLGPSNILYDLNKQSIGGIIDFGSAGLGDPSVDVANLLRYGEMFLQHAAAVYPRIIELLTRAKFYVGTFALQQALFGIEHTDEHAFRDGIAKYS